MRLSDLLKRAKDVASLSYRMIELIPRDKAVFERIQVGLYGGSVCYCYEYDGGAIRSNRLHTFMKDLEKLVNLNDDWVLSLASQGRLLREMTAMNYFLHDTLGSVQKEEGVAAAVAMSNSDEDMDKRDALRRKWIKKYGYGLSPDELSDMAKKFLNAVKTGNIRLAATVLDYLEDINYHSECAEFCSGLASMYVMK